MENDYKAYRLMEIEDEIKQAESKKSNGVIMMVVSIFIIWPLLIAGAVTYDNAVKRIKQLNEEKKRLMFSESNEPNEIKEVEEKKSKRKKK